MLNMANHSGACKHFVSGASNAESEMAKDDDKNKPPKPKEFTFFVNGKKYETDQSELTGAQIKAKVPDWPAGYGLMLEGVGDEENRLIGDDEPVSLEKEHGPRRFVSVPPATYGC
jgi:hypothetical protein